MVHRNLVPLIGQTSDRAFTSRDLMIVAIVIGAAAVLTRFFRPVLRTVLTRLARTTKPGRSSGWRARTPRLLGETVEQAELRREQRITATAAGLSRLLSIVVWIGVIVVVLERAAIDPAVAVSAAGFLGAAVAFGAQHSVNDFLTGLHILLEDRFGEGDRLRLEVNGSTVDARVAFLGAFSTRLEGDDATYHVPNRELTKVRNLSQRGAAVEIEFEPSAEIPAVANRAAIETAVRKRYVQSLGYDPSRDGLVVDTVEQDDRGFRVQLRTARPLSDAQVQDLAVGRSPGHVSEAEPGNTTEEQRS